MTLSIIIPTYNEAENIEKLINHLLKFSDERLVEIIVADGGSTDKTQEICRKNSIVLAESPQKGRAFQMNFGASFATGNSLFFVHADTFPPKTYLDDLEIALKNSYNLGRYRAKYESKNWLLKLNSFFSRFDIFVGMGGDQTLFITKQLFDECGGFDPQLQIMEEFEFCVRARKLSSRYKIIPKAVLISARKYQKNGWLKVQFANYTIVKMYKNGASQQEMVERYREILR